MTPFISSDMRSSKKSFVGVILFLVTADIFQTLGFSNLSMINIRFQKKFYLKQFTLSVAPELTLVFSGVDVARSLVFSVFVCRSLFVLLSVFPWTLYGLSFELRLLIIPVDIFKLLIYLCSEL